MKYFLHRFTLCPATQEVSDIVHYDLVTSLQTIFPWVEYIVRSVKMTMMIMMIVMIMVIIMMMVIMIMFQSWLDRGRSSCVGSGSGS